MPGLRHKPGIFLSDAEENPGLPQKAEHELMKKSWALRHLWRTHMNKELPTGVPQLMMGFTADGQADPAMVGARDKRFGIEKGQKRKEREDIQSPPIEAGADAWEKGKAVQIPDPTG